MDQPKVGAKGKGGGGQGANGTLGRTEAKTREGKETMAENEEGRDPRLSGKGVAGKGELDRGGLGGGGEVSRSGGSCDLHVK